MIHPGPTLDHVVINARDRIEFCLALRGRELAR